MNGFRFATSDLVIACPASDRYFDLDAVRTPQRADTIEHAKKYHANGRRAERYLNTDRVAAGANEMTSTANLNPAGAPPLDWWLIDPHAPYNPPKKDGPMTSARFIVGDTREVTASLADGSVDLILTSPPFLALRSYLPADHPDKGKEIGSEANPAAFIDVLLELTAEWRRILAPHGSIVIELGDTYSGSGGAGGDYGADGLREGQEKFDGSAKSVRRGGQPDDEAAAVLNHLLSKDDEEGWFFTEERTALKRAVGLLEKRGGVGWDYNADGLRDGQPKVDGSAKRQAFGHNPGDRPLVWDSENYERRKAMSIRERGPFVSGGQGWPLPKCLALVPELYRVALAYGINPLTGQPSPAGRWRVRNVVRWVRPNPPVGALGDKFRPATSDLVVACVAGDRWFDLDAVRTPASADPAARGPKWNGGKRLDPERNTGSRNDDGHLYYNNGNPAGAPPLDWWQIAGQQENIEHAAVLREMFPLSEFARYSKVRAAIERGIELLEADPGTPNDWWQIVPGGYSGAHYAVWPPALCEKPIEAMCPRRVCRTCGKPSRRITGEVEYTSTTGGRVVDHFRGVERAGHALTWAVEGGNPGHVVRTAPTVGWSSCGCPNTDGLQLDGYHTGTGWRPGLVFDPFVGSGTTLVVAHGHSRDSIGADLDPRNAELAKERLGMFLDVETTERVA